MAPALHPRPRHARHRSRLAAAALGVALTFVALPSAAPAASAQAPAAVVPGNDWVVEAPALHGMDQAKIDQAMAYAFQNGKNTQGVVVVRDGVIVAEQYAPGAGPASWAASWSMAKSFASALIGIAIAEGKIPSIDTPMTTWFPEWVGTPRESITLHDVLHMESGLAWNEDYDPVSLGSSDIINMVGLQPDQLAYAASRPAKVPPGTDWNYSSGDSMLLSGVIAKATGMSAEEYARQKLIGPIGISQFDWWRDAAGHTLTYCCVDTTSRDFARFGLLYLRGGSWDGQQVVPASWVSASITDQAKTYGGYGLQWWLHPNGNGPVPPYYAAIGHDGQWIYVIPSLDLVVVRNGLYVKSPCRAVADPNLLYYYPPQGLVPGQGTIGPDSWSDRSFLAPIVESVTGNTASLGGGTAGAGAAAVGPAEDRATTLAAAPGSSSGKKAAADPAPCPAEPTASTTPTSTPAVVVVPAFTG